MVSIYDLKPKFQNLLRPTVNKLSAAGVSENQITILAMLLSFLAGGLVYLFSNWQWLLLIIPFVLLIRMALNAIDGMITREYNMKSSLGAFLHGIACKKGELNEWN